MSHKVLIQPLDVVIQTSSETYEQLTAELLGDSDYYFSSSPIGGTQYGHIPTSGLVYLRQKSTILTAIEELVSNDPIIVDIAPNGKGHMKLHSPIPKGFILSLRKIYFSAEPTERTFYLNGDGPISFIYQGNTGLLDYPLTDLQPAFTFTRISHIRKVEIGIVPTSPLDAVQALFPGNTGIRLNDFFQMIERPFQKFGDHSYRYTWTPEGRKLKGVELPPGLSNWKVFLTVDGNDLMISNINGIAPIRISPMDRDIEIILIPPKMFIANTIKVQLYFDIINDTEVTELRVLLKQAETEIRRLQRKMDY